MFKKYLTAFDSYIIYTSSVLGLGLIVLPAMAAREAGTWSLFIWLLLGLLSYPMARTMGDLGARYPSSGGVTNFIRVAFGKNMGNLAGVLYLLALFIGPVAASLFFAEYISIVIPLNRNQQAAAAILFLLLLIFVNLLEVRATMLFQRWIFMSFLIFVCSALALTIPYVNINNFSFPPAQISQLKLATFICFYAFIGWEHAAFSSIEMINSTSLVKSIYWSVVTVTSLFLMTAFVLIGVLPNGTIMSSNTVISDLFMHSFGSAASKISAMLVLILYFGMMLSWVRGGGRLVHSLAIEGLLPNRLSAISKKTGSPYNGLILLGCIWVLVIVLYLGWSLKVDNYVRLSNANYIVTYLLVFCAAIKLRNGSKLLLLYSIVSLVSIIAICYFSYKDFWYPFAVAGCFFSIQFFQGKSIASEGRSVVE